MKHKCAVCSIEIVSHCCDGKYSTCATCTERLNAVLKLTRAAGICCWGDSRTMEELRLGLRCPQCLEIHP